MTRQELDTLWQKVSDKIIARDDLALIKRLLQDNTFLYYSDVNDRYIIVIPEGVGMVSSNKSWIKIIKETFFEVLGQKVKICFANIKVVEETIEDKLGMIEDRLEKLEVLLTDKFSKE